LDLQKLSRLLLPRTEMANSQEALIGLVKSIYRLHPFRELNLNRLAFPNCSRDDDLTSYGLAVLFG